MPEESLLPQTPQTEQFSPRKKTMIIAGVVLGVAIIATTWMILNPAKEPEQAKQPQGDNVPVLPESQQIDWRVFANPKFGYAFKYPNTWAIDKTDAEKDFSNNSAGQVTVSSRPDPLALLESGNPPADLAMMTFEIHQTDLKKTVDEFISEKKYGPAFSQMPVNYENISGRQLFYIQTRPDKREVLNVITVLKKDDKMYVFSYYSFKPDGQGMPSEAEIIHDEILNSFSLN